MSSHRHIAQSVDVDERDDAYIRRFILPQFTRAFGSRTVRDVRQQCELARRKGLDVFPPCDHTDKRGYCLGHEESEVSNG